MAKVKINKLPPGFALEDGKIVERMEEGGSTGDQSGYSMVKYPTSVTSGQMSDKESSDVRYSLSSVPRDMANLEAEGGETVLTDLNNDGNFGLYDIKGPRHSQGGVPMFLPEQSFVYSDTKEMKMKGSELAEFGIESKKSITPADISRRYQLNKFYGAIDDEFADEMQVKSAELMLDKNKMGLSKLAFNQEMKKQFEDGVPLASHPYLLSIGEDPIAFTARVEDMNEQQAMMKVFDALPPEQQQQVLALQEFMAQAQQMPQQGQPQMQVDQPAMPVARDGMETLPEFQKKGEFSVYDPGFAENLKKLGYDVDFSSIAATDFSRVQGADPNAQGSLFGGAEKNLPGFYQEWEGLYPGLDKLKEAIAKASPGETVPEVGDFQNWINDVYIAEQAKAAAPDDPAKQKELENLLRRDYGFSGTTGKKVDSKMGTNTSAMRPLSITATPQGAVQTEKKTETKKLESGDVSDPKPLPKPSYWLQDLAKMSAMARRKRNLYLPYQPEAEDLDIDYVLEDPTRAVAAIAEQANIINTANNMYAGAQAGSAKAASTAGKSMKAAADAVAAVQARNVNTINRGEYQNAMLDATINRENRDRNVKEFDDTTVALQRYDDERNFDREQLADYYANAMTNMANTYNMNLMQDYFQIDPSTGGMIGQVSGRAFDPVKPQDRMEDYLNMAAELKRNNIEPTADLLAKLLPQESGMPMTNIQAEYARQQPYMQYNQYGAQGFPGTMYPGMYPGMYGQNPYGYYNQTMPYPRMEEGGEKKKLKKFATPFYTGKTGV